MALPRRPCLRCDGDMRALVLARWRQAPELRDVLLPEPRAGEVLLRVAAAGACHSDLHLMEFPPGAMPFDPPFVLGHEITGHIAELGPGVTGLSVDQPVAVYGPWGCGRCMQCRIGAENYCEHAADLGKLAPGIGHDGGMADFVRVPSRLLVPLGDLDPVGAAPLTDAALTPYHAIKRSLALLVPGSTAVVIGAGGLGHLAVQLLRTLAPSRIVVVDVAKAKRRQALELGADDALSPDDVEAHVAATTAGLGAELVLDLVGSDATLALAARLARVRGHLTVVGIAGGTLPFNFFGLPYECSVASTYWGSITELGEVLALARAGRIVARVEEFPLSHALDAYDRMRAGTLNGRAVIVPGG